MAEKPPDPGRFNPWRQASLALTLPMLMVSGPIVGYFMGYGLAYWLDLGDRWASIVKIVGVVLGMIAGVRETIRVIKKISDDQ